jgi:predicted nucleic acid-binding protein
MNPPRVFLDASVLFAAAASATGASRAIIVLAEIGLIRVIVSSQVLEEAERNLSRKAPRALPFYRQVIASLSLEMVGEPAPGKVAECAKVIEAKDAPILAAAMEAKPARLVTLDIQHFVVPEVMAFSKLTIQTPGEFMQEIRRILVTAYGSVEEGSGSSRAR